MPSVKSSRNSKRNGTNASSSSRPSRGNPNSPLIQTTSSPSPSPSLSIAGRRQSSRGGSRGNTSTGIQEITILDDPYESDSTIAGDTFEVERVMGKRETEIGQFSYLLKWKGYDETTWEPEAHCGCNALIEAWETRSARPRLTSNGFMNENRGGGINRTRNSGNSNNNTSNSNGRAINCLETGSAGDAIVNSVRTKIVPKRTRK